VPLRELPAPLQAAIDELVRGVERSRLEAAAVRLTAAYRKGGVARAARTREDAVAYVAQRAPATYAAAVAVLAGLREQRPGWRPRSLLDAGAGPGTAAWAARAVWPDLERIVLVEAEPEMIALGRELGLPGAEWIAGELEGADGGLSGPFDLVLAAYVLNELPDDRLDEVARSLWGHTADALVVVEPGTPAGYARVLAVRAEALAAGGSTLAPCPHDAPCPLERPDWCHFAVRLQRGESHRAVKAVSRGFEDEKFSYAALTREPHARAVARIIRQPQVRSGHVLLDLCEPAGIRRATVSRRDREAYRRARKAAWGDAVELSGGDLGAD
jgi:ribosomal protein RSM22 (predicted rRNA methylase)